LPLKNADELQRWLVNVKLEDKQLLPSDRICSEHFTRDCVINDGVKIILRTGSVPTLFMSEHNCTKCVFCKFERSAKCSRTFHKFPIGNSTELLKWLSAMPLKDFVPKKSDLLCSDHFDPNCFRWNRNALRLKPNAVPTIFVPQLIAGK
ncbi:THAP domain-containing protein 8, partial [Cyphomyrmex costatus]